jgi:hypothetical protein
LLAKQVSRFRPGFVLGFERRASDHGGGPSWRIDFLAYDGLIPIYQHRFESLIGLALEELD